MPSKPRDRPPTARRTAHDDLALAQLGDKEAFRRIYDRNVSAIFSFVSTRVDRNDVDDITAETFCIAWRKLPDYQQGETPLIGWLMAIARNLAASHHRRTAKLSITPSTTGDLPSPTLPSSAVETLERLDRELLAHAMQRLDSRSLQVLTLRFLRELTVREAADVIGCSPENVRIRTFRALAELRSLTSQGLNIV